MFCQPINRFMLVTVSVLHGNMKLLNVHVQVDGDTSTNDTLLALTSGASGCQLISDIESREAQELQRALDAVRTSNNFNELFVQTAIAPLKLKILVL
jgi:hypothetical protein